MLVNYFGCNPVLVDDIRQGFQFDDHGVTRLNFVVQTALQTQFAAALTRVADVEHICSIQIENLNILKSTNPISVQCVTLYIIYLDVDF